MRIAEFIEREAGHVIIGFAMIWTGVALIKLAIPEGRDLIVGGAAWVARSMGTAAVQMAKAIAKGQGQ